jgi:hypothetical protein
MTKPVEGKHPRRPGVSEAISIASRHRGTLASRLGPVKKGDCPYWYRLKNPLDGSGETRWNTCAEKFGKTCLCEECDRNHQP